LVLLDLLVSSVLPVPSALKAKTVPVVFAVTSDPPVLPESRVWSDPPVWPETRDPAERAALLELLVPPDLRVSSDPEDSLVCPAQEEIVVFLAVPVAPERLVELDPLVPPDPVGLLETLACLA